MISHTIIDHTIVFNFFCKCNLNIKYDVTDYVYNNALFELKVNQQLKGYVGHFPCGLLFTMI